MLLHCNTHDTRTKLTAKMDCCTRRHIIMTTHHERHVDVTRAAQRARKSVQLLGVWKRSARLLLEPRLRRLQLGLRWCAGTALLADLRALGLRCVTACESARECRVPEDKSSACVQLTTAGVVLAVGSSQRSGTITTGPCKHSIPALHPGTKQIRRS